MEKRIIKISKIDEIKGKKNDKDYTVYKVFDENNIFYSGFKKPEVETGKTYDLEYEQKDQFMNYISFKEVTPVNPASFSDKEALRNALINEQVNKKIAIRIVQIATEYKVDVAEVVKEFKKALDELSK
jgi:hypothetical protein